MIELKEQFSSFKQTNSSNYWEKLNENLVKENSFLKEKIDSLLQIINALSSKENIDNNKAYKANEKTWTLPKKSVSSNLIRQEKTIQLN